jgi:hypothetical protein
MKIISLNTFGGTVFRPLIEFIKGHAADTDVFCFQEMYKGEQFRTLTSEKGIRLNLFQEISTILPAFNGYFSPTQDDYGVQKTDSVQTTLGTAIFVRKTLTVLEQGSFFLVNGRNTYDGKDDLTLGYNASYITIDNSGTPLTVIGLHGVSMPAHKLDTPLRQEQSQKIIDFLKERSGEKIVMGDFNLLPETESIKMFAKDGFKNLIDDYSIKTTRGSHMRVLFPHYADGPYGFQEFADYTFVSKGMDVKSFEVPDEPISDHLPMILEI